MSRRVRYVKVIPPPHDCAEPRGSASPYHETKSRVGSGARLAGLVWLEQFLELFDCEARVSNDTAHRVCVDRIIARDRDNSSAVRHHDMFALGGDVETGFFERSNRSKMIDAG